MSISRLTPEKVEEILEMAATGQFDAAAIAREHDLHVTTVRKLCKVNNIELPRIRKVDTIAKEIKDEVVASFMQGEKIISILSKHRLTYMTFYSIVAEYPEAQAQRSEYNAEALRMRKDRAVELYEQGAPIWKIKSETGLGHTELQITLEERGIRRRASAASMRREYERNQASLWDPNNPRPPRAIVPDNADGETGHPG